jgi:nucleotide-binding universal stress UspA family protein
MKILLAIDDSRFSQAALRVVAAQFQPKHNQVRVLHVVEEISAYLTASMVPHLVDQAAQIEKDRQRQAKQMVQHAARLLRKTGFQASEAVETGDPKEEIVDHAEKWRADLIVLGSHGWKGLNRFLLGSVSEAVSRHAKCSVQIVRVPFARKQKKAGKPSR